jgi:hypothetical protein
MAATAGTTAATGWEGVGGAAMVATAMPYVAALEALPAGCSSPRHRRPRSSRLMSPPRPR